MKLIVGLGNPGAKYETTRHNAGFLVIDDLIDRYAAKGPKVQHQGEIFTAQIRGEPVLLVKPQTFMNLSGKTVGPLYQFHKLTPADLIVIHDEVDLPPLSFKVKTGGGTGGHNGLKSIDASIGASENAYHRIRFGVGHPRTLNLRMETADYVLQRFSDDELDAIPSLFDQIAKAIELVVKGDATRAMTEFNQKKPTNA